VIRRPRHIVAAAVALVVAGGVAAGIVLAFTGGSSADATTTGYFAGVAKICRSYGPRFDAIPPPNDVTVPGTVVTPLKRVIPLLRAQTAEVRALKPPPALAARVDRWLALKDRVLAALERALAAAEMPDIPRTATAYLKFLTLAQKTAKLGGRIGFPSVCSSAS
jgi:hypothetical protein